MARCQIWAQGPSTNRVTFFRWRCAMDLFLDFLVFLLGLSVVSLLIVGLFVLGWYLLYLWGVLTYVSESTAKHVMRGGSRRKTLFSKQGFRLDVKNNLTLDPGYKQPRCGGWRLVGWPWLDRVYTYTWSWIKVRPDGTLQEKGPETVDYITVGQRYVYGKTIKGKGVVDKNLVPLEVDLALPGMIVNPVKAQFDVRDWFAAFVSLIEPAVRDYANCWAYSDIISSKDRHLDHEIWDRITLLGKDGNPKSPINPSMVDELENVYGFKLLGVECKAIRQADEYQKIQLEGWQGEQEAKRFASIMTSLVASVANVQNRPLAEVQEEFKTDLNKALKKYKRFLDRSQKVLLRKMGYETGSVRQFLGARGGLDLANVLGEAFRGGSSGGTSSDRSSDTTKKKGDKNGGPKKRYADLTEEEKKALADELERLKQT